MRRTTRSCLSGMLAVAAVGVFAGSLPETVVAASGATPPAVTFAYTGAPQTYVVPAGVCAVSVDAFGAQGGSGLTLSVAPGVDMPPVVPVPGGRGAGVTSRLAVVPGETLQVDVGGEGGGGPEATSGPEAGGWNGGGRGGDLHPVFGGGGGGASDVRQGGTSLGDRVVVAGGGGGSGAGSGSPYSDPQPTGGGGGATGKVGGPGRVVVLEGFGVPTVTQIGDGPGGGGGGSATAGGEPGSGQVVVGAPSGPDGEPGLLGRGGDAPQNTSHFLGVQTFVVVPRAVAGEVGSSAAAAVAQRTDSVGSEQKSSGGSPAVVVGAGRAWATRSSPACAKATAR